VTTPEVAPRFDPRAVLASFQRADVAFVVIGGLARVIRGTDELTDGVDICPSRVAVNRDRVQAALDELGATKINPTRPTYTPGNARQPQILRLNTIAGPISIVATPTGVPRGYDALRTGATVEHLGGGLQPLVASTSDLIAMAAARGRPEDLAVVPQLQRILQLEASPSRIVETPLTPGYEVLGQRIESPGPEL
jgi:hypothetical protein